MMAFDMRVALTPVRRSRFVFLFMLLVLSSRDYLRHRGLCHGYTVHLPTKETLARWIGTSNNLPRIAKPHDANNLVLLHAKRDTTNNNRQNRDENQGLEVDALFVDEDTIDNDEEILDYAIDSFLRGDYDYEYSEDAPAPLPGLTPNKVIDLSLRALRDLDHPYPNHGAAVFLRFCLPLSKGERWGDSSRTPQKQDAWKEIMRGALTPSMLARRIRASPDFSGLLDWEKLDVTEGALLGKEQDLVGVPSIAFVNAAMYFAGDSAAPLLIQFTLRRTIGGVWLIDTARKNNPSK